MKLSKNMKRKLTSRKFWVAVGAFVTLIAVTFGLPEATAERITSIIVAGATVVAWIIGEGLIDCKNIKDTMSGGIDEDEQ